MGSSDVRCTEDDLLVLHQQRDLETFDYTALLDAELNDIDQEAVQDYRKSRIEVHPNAEELQWVDEELLQSLGCLRKIKNQLVPIVAGILLFGTSKAIRRLFPLMRVDYIRVPGKQWVEDHDHRFISIEIRSPIMSTIGRALSAIIDDLPKQFSLPEGGLQRQDIPIIPTVVIREAVVNAVMHRNYRINQPIQIIRYANRLEIRNLGYSLIAPDHLGEPGSKSRNAKIAETLHETRFAETKGSGIRIMRENMRKAGLSPPIFESDRNQDLFTVTFLFHHFLSDEDLQWLANFRDLHLSDKQALALIFAKELGAINNEAFRSINHVDTLNASNALRHLRDLGLLEAKGQGPSTYYKPTEKLLAPLFETLNSFETHQSKDETHQFAEQVEEDERLVQIKELPQQIREILEKLTKKSPILMVRKAIMILCKWQTMTPNQLSALLNREKKHLVRKYLSPMVKEELLIYQYPQMTAHPRQAYKIHPSRK